MTKTARQIALTIIQRCRRDQAFSDTLLNSALTESSLGKKDRALVSKLCYGVLQNTLLCDFYIDSFSGGKKIEPKVRDILRLSVYQLLFLDKIPDHAVVSEGVELSKQCGMNRASGFVNAILHKIADNKNNLPQIPETDKIKYLSVKYSTPPSLVTKFFADFGEDFTEKLLCVNNEPAPTTIQVNSLKTTAEELLESLSSKGFDCRDHALLADCIDISGGDLTATDEFIKGYFYVQDAAARLAVLAASPAKGDFVLDACAAPGGKSFTSAILMQNDGKIISCDIHKNKLRLISDGAERLGISIISTEEMDAAQPDDNLCESFDIVIADVPCSGLGIIRKKPDIRYKDLTETEKLPEIQLAILDGLAPCVKVGGVLLYSTCTVLKRENEDVVSVFLAKHNEFTAESFALPEPLIAAESGMITLYPHIHGTDGFFICKLRKCYAD